MTAPGYKVENDEEIGSLGTVDLVEATALSVNTGYVKAALKVGIDKVMETARLFGVPAAALAPFKGQAGIALGIPDVSAVTQAAGYAAFANGGTAVVPHLVTKVVDGNGHRVPLPWDRPGGRVLNGEQAAQAAFAMRATVESGTGRRAALAGRQAAGKTGTTEHNRAAWFVGFVPQVSTAVVIGDAKPRTLRGLPGFSGTVAGENLPSTVWHAFMAKAVQDLPVKTFPQPAFSGVPANWAGPDPDEKTGPPGVGTDPGLREREDAAKRKREQAGRPPEGTAPATPRKPSADGRPVETPAARD
jgi:membrane peptidoglycan carboxypeptidase